jgi:kynureninase
MTAPCSATTCGHEHAAVFKAARAQFLIPDGVAYCNTGTLGASPREVVDALTAGLRRVAASA